MATLRTEALQARDFGVNLNVFLVDGQTCVSIKTRKSGVCQVSYGCCSNLVFKHMDCHDTDQKIFNFS